MKNWFLWSLVSLGIRLRGNIFTSFILLYFPTFIQIKHFIVFKCIYRPAEIPVFNLTTGDDRNTTWKEVLDIGKKTVKKYPFEGPLWYPGGNIRHNKYIHQLCVFFYHILPAYFIDFLLFFLRQKRLWVYIFLFSQMLVYLCFYYTKIIIEIMKIWVF